MVRRTDRVCESPRFSIFLVSHSFIVAYSLLCKTRNCKNNYDVLKRGIYSNVKKKLRFISLRDNVTIGITP